MLDYFHKVVNEREIFETAGYIPAWSTFMKVPFGHDCYAAPMETASLLECGIAPVDYVCETRRITGPYERCKTTISDYELMNNNRSLASHFILNTHLAEKSRRVYAQIAASACMVEMSADNFYTHVNECIFYVGRKFNTDVWTMIVSPLTRAMIEMELAGSLLLPQQKRDWDCGYCGSHWTHEEIKCWDGVSGCGAPNDQLVWRCVYCGRTFAEKPTICWDGTDGCGAIDSATRSRSLQVGRDGQIGIFDSLPLQHLIDDPFVEPGRAILFPARIFGTPNIVMQDEWGGDVISRDLHSRHNDIRSSFRIGVKLPESVYVISVKELVNAHR